LIVLAGTLTYTFHLGDLAGRHDAAASGYAYRYAEETRKIINDCWSSADQAVLEKCVNDAIEFDRDGQRSEEELAAQKEMAEWAFWALIVATASVFVTSSGTILLYQQVILTREAVEDTSRATAAMEKQNEFMQAQAAPDIRINCCLFEHQNNAWLNITASNFGGSKVADFQISSAIISISETAVDEVAMKNRADRDDIVDISFNGSSHGFDFRAATPLPSLTELRGRAVEARIAWRYKNLLGKLETDDGAWKGIIAEDPHQLGGSRADMVRKA